MEFLIFATKQGLRRAGALGDYERLVRRGFLLEWTLPGDCAACDASGGQCRHDADVNAFRCLCPDGSTQPAMCPRGELVTDPTIPHKSYFS